MLYRIQISVEAIASIVSYFLEESREMIEHMQTGFSRYFSEILHLTGS